MKTIHSAETTPLFSPVIKDTEAGKKETDTKGGCPKRQLGTLEGKMSVKFSGNFAITDEELVTCFCKPHFTTSDS